MHAKNFANARHPDTSAFRSGSGPQDAILSAIGRAETLRHQRFHDWSPGRARYGSITIARSPENGR